MVQGRAIRLAAPHKSAFEEHRHPTSLPTEPNHGDMNDGLRGRRQALIVSPETLSTLPRGLCAASSAARAGAKRGHAASASPERARRLVWATPPPASMRQARQFLVQGPPLSAFLKRFHVAGAAVRRFGPIIDVFHPVSQHPIPQASQSAGHGFDRLLAPPTGFATFGTARPDTYHFAADCWRPS